MGFGKAFFIRNAKTKQSNESEGSKKMKKVTLLYLLIAAALFVSLAFMSACNRDDGVVTLEFRLIGSGQPDIDRISDAVNAHLESLGRDYRVSLYIQEWGDWWDGTVDLALSTGEPIDLMFMANWAGDVLHQAAVGALRPMCDYLRRFPEIEAVLGADFMNASQVNGRNYALPVNKEKARSFGWMVRTDIADAMGMDIASIKTLDDLEPYLYKAFREHGMFTYSWVSQLDHHFDPLPGTQFAIGTEPGSTQVFFYPISDIARASVMRASQWNADGLKDPNRNPDTQSFESQFIAGRTWAATQQLKPGAAAERMGNIDGIPLAQIDFTYPPQIANAETTGAMITMPAGGRNPDEAFDFIRLLYTDPVLVNLIVFGQAGIDYEYLNRNAGIVRLLPSGWDFAGQGWTLGNQFFNYLTEHEDPNKWNDFIAFNEAAVPLPSLGFIPDRTDVQLQTYLANIDATMERYKDLFDAFVHPSQVNAQFDALYNDLVASGLYEAQAIFQAQFDAWRAR
jgi:putative aldouronate transport system substrate-binding protein